MNGGHCRGANLPFEPSTKHDGEVLIVQVIKAINNCINDLIWQNEAKMLNVFNEQSDGLWNCRGGRNHAPDLAAPTG